MSEVGVYSNKGDGHSKNKYGVSVDARPLMMGMLGTTVIYNVQMNIL